MLRIFRLVYMPFIIFILLANYSEIKAQELQTKIKANHKIYTPEGKGPFPVLIAFPGCSGVSLNGPKTDVGRQGDEVDRLFRRHYAIMAKRLQREGFQVVLIDYLSAEGVLNTCGGEITQKRVGDYIKEAISFVKTQTISDTSRITVIGWSHGGAGVLEWLANFDGDFEGVKSAIAVYPQCRNKIPWESSLPILMILGEQDDVTLASTCNTLVKSLPKQTNVKVVSYEGARHGFDFTEGPSLITIDNGLTFGRHQEAGDKAWKEILNFLNQN